MIITIDCCKIICPAIKQFSSMTVCSYHVRYAFHVESSCSHLIFQYVYSNVFAEIYCYTEKKGFDLNSNFYIMFKTYKDKKQLESSMGKNLANYETIQKETNIYEQKPVNITDFNDCEEAEVKERVEKRKNKRRKVAEKTNC